MPLLEHELDLLRRGRISRRTFMVRASALGIGATLASNLAAQAAMAAVPKRGGHLRIGLGHGNTVDSLNPATYTNDFTGIVCYSVFNHLTEIGGDGELIPDLAESWEPSADAATWAFKLRKGVEFHDGRPLTTADVIASINHHRHEDSESAAKPLVERITEIKADGPDTVVVSLDGGNADFPFLLSDYHLPIMPAKDNGEIDWESGIGTGGYVLKSFEPGVRMRFERNPNYWRDGAAHFDSAEVLAILDSTARTTALTTGEVDVIDRVELRTARRLANQPGVRVEETSGNQHYTFAMFTDTAPFNDNNVRLALKHAIDRQELLDKILYGHGYLGNDHPIGRANRYQAGDIPQRHYDPDKAKFYLEKAGLSTLNAQLHAADAAFNGAVDAAVLYKEQAAPTGINIDVVREPNDGYWSNVWLNKPWVAVYWFGRPTEDWMFSTVYAEGAPWNDTHWSHDRFNKLLNEARAELDDARRRAMYFEAQQLVSDEGGAVIPIFANFVFAMRDNVRHPDQLSANIGLDGLQLVERWWFE